MKKLLNDRKMRFPEELKSNAIEELLPEEQFIYHIEHQSKLATFEKIREKYHDIDINHLLFSPDAKSYEIETGSANPEDTLLTLSTRYLNYDVTNWLVEQGVEKEISVKNNETVFHLAARLNDVKMMFILLNNEIGQNLSELRNDEGMSPFDISFDEFKNSKICAKMITHGTEYNFFEEPTVNKNEEEEDMKKNHHHQQQQQLIFKACQIGSTEYFDILLYLGVSPYFRDFEGNSILHHIISSSNDISNNKKLYLEYLVKKLSKLPQDFVNSENHKGETILELLLFQKKKNKKNKNKNIQEEQEQEKKKQKEEEEEEEEDIISPKKIELVKYLITKLGCNIHHINSKTRLGYLHRAVVEEDESIISLLLSKDAKFKISTKDGMGNLPLHYLSKSVKIYQLLSTETRKTNDLSNSLNFCGFSPFHNILISCPIPIIKLALAEKKLNLKVRTGMGQNILHLISRRGNQEILNLVLQKLPTVLLKQQIEEQDRFKHTPLEICIIERNQEVGCCLVSKNSKIIIQPLTYGTSSTSPKSSGRSGRKNKQQQQIIKKEEEETEESLKQKNLLQEAVKRKLSKLVKTIISRELQKRNSNKVNNTKKSPSKSSSSKNNNNNEKIIKTDEQLLFEMMNWKDENKRTPLHNAVIKNDFESVEALLESQVCRIDEVESIDHCTPLMISCREGFSEIALSLLKREARPNFSDIKGRIALHFAARRCEGSGVEICKILIDNKSLINKKGDDGRTPLHEACVADSNVVVEYLILHGAEIECRDGQGMTPLHVAVAHGSVRATKVLIKHDADLKVLDNFGRSPLVLSSESKTPQCGKLIIRASLKIK